jgi:hypothetical protein
VRFTLFALLTALAVPAAFGQTSVLTQDYDNARSGANLGEATLNPSNVSSSTFGRLFSYAVDEEVFAQPLYVPNLLINGGVHNVVVIATMGNSVYAFDADNPATANAPLWTVNMGTPVPSSKFFWRGGSGAVQNGILSTPVIDPNSNTIYTVSQLWDTHTQSLTFLLHALDLLSGTEKFNGPVPIAVPGFNTNTNIQRAGLLLLNGVVYLGIASHADLRIDAGTGLGGQQYVGFVLAYDAQSLGLLGSFNVDAGGTGGGIWQGGRGLVSDGRYIYAAAGNAITPGSPDYSESFVKLNPGSLSVADYFPDPDQTCLNKLDLELSSSGPQLMNIDGTNVLLGGGKQGKVYALSLNQPLQTQQPSYFWGTSNHATLPAEGGTCNDPRKVTFGWLQGSDTALWSNPSGASYYYAFGNQDQLMSWQVSGMTFTQTSADALPSTSPNAAALSANGGTDAILWTVAGQPSLPAIVSAFNAVPAAGHLTKLWDSTQVTTRDTLGTLGKYSVPTVAAGKVYIGTGSNQVAVYGLLPTTPSVQLAVSNPTLRLVALNSITEKIYINAIAGFKGTVKLTVSGLPPGTSYSLSKTSVALTKNTTSAASTLTIAPGTAVLPLNDHYTVVVQATTTTGVTRYAPVRLVTRNGLFLSTTSAGCNNLNQMSANLKWQINGSGVPSIWIQDPQTPSFPGRPWLDPAQALGMGTTGYSITSSNQLFLYWIIDQSAGLPANFDNALGFTNLAKIYKCP